MKRILIYCILGTLLMSACAPMPQMVSLTTASEIKSYVQEAYGGATVLHAEYKEHSNVYTLRDNVYGFEYYVGCYLEPIKLDNTVMGYKEVKRSNYEAKYLETLWSKLDTDNVQEGVHVIANPAALSGNATTLGYVIVNSELDAEKALDASMVLGTQLNALDTKRVLQGYILGVRDRHGNMIGRFEFEGCKNISEQMAMYSSYRRQAQEILRHQDVSMYETESMRFEDVPGLKNEILAEERGPANEIVYLYHFVHNNQRYFVADVKVVYGDREHYYMYNLTEEHSMTSILYPYIPNLDR